MIRLKLFSLNPRWNKVPVRDYNAYIYLSLILIPNLDWYNIFHKKNTKENTSISNWMEQILIGFSNLVESCFDKHGLRGRLEFENFTQI